MLGAARLTAHGSAGGGPLLVGAAGAATPGGGPGVLVAVFELTAGAPWRPWSLPNRKPVNIAATDTAAARPVSRPA